MTVQLNGRVFSGQHLTSGMDFYLLETEINILQAGSRAPAGATNAGTIIAGPDVAVNGMAPDTPIAVSNSQVALNRLIEVIGTRGQMVIMGTPFFDDAGDMPYKLRFAIEHKDSWFNTTQGPTPAVTDAWSSRYHARNPSFLEAIAQLQNGVVLYPGTLNHTFIPFTDAGFTMPPGATSVRFNAVSGNIEALHPDGTTTVVGPPVGFTLSNPTANPPVVGNTRVTLLEGLA